MSNQPTNQTQNNKSISFEEFRNTVLNDYRIACESRETSLLGRKEVLTGKAKFGIFGDGKEIAQIAMAKSFLPGDFRSGYYRDQTFMMAAGLLTIQEFFAQLYAHADAVAEPMSAGRSMNGHFATRTLNEDGSWKSLTENKNSSADISPTAGQMPRLLVLAYASKVFRKNEELRDYTEKKDFKFNKTTYIFFTLFILTAFFVWYFFSGKSNYGLQIFKYTFLGFIYYISIGTIIQLDSKNWLKKIFLSKALCFSGGISYGLYIYHPLCFLLLNQIIGFHYLIVNFLISFLFTYIVADLSFNYFEYPFIKLKSKIAN